MKNVSTIKVATMEDVNRELDKIRNLLASVPEPTASSGGVPAGVVFAYGGTTAPDGYIMGNGTVYKSADYPAVAAIYCNPTWGNVVGAPTFKVDIRAATIRGVGTSTVFTSNATIALGQIINDQLQGYTFVIASDTDKRLALEGSNTTPSTTGVDANASVISARKNYSAYMIPGTDGTNGIPRIGLETTGKAIGMNWIIKT